MLTQEDEEVLWWLLQRHAATAAAGSTAGMPAGADEPEEGGGGCLGAGASPAAAQDPCLNYDDFTQAGGSACLGNMTHSAGPLRGGSCGHLFEQSAV